MRMRGLDGNPGVEEPRRLQRSTKIEYQLIDERVARYGVSNPFAASGYALSSLGYPKYIYSPSSNPSSLLPNLCLPSPPPKLSLSM